MIHEAHRFYLAFAWVYWEMTKGYCCLWEVGRVQLSNPNSSLTLSISSLISKASPLLAWFNTSVVSNANWVRINTSKAAFSEKTLVKLPVQCPIQ